MKILLLTQVLPFPPDSGPKVKTYNLLKYLARSHEVTLVSFVRGDQSEEIRTLRKICRAVYTLPIHRNLRYEIVSMARSLMTNQPWLMLRDGRSEMKALIRRVITQEHFDFVHADQLNMAQYAWDLPGIKKVLDEHNALWLLYQRLADQLANGPKKWVFSREAGLLRKYEGRACRDFDFVLAVSDEDKKALNEVAKDREILVIPITVDTDELAPVERALQANHLIHIGTMFWLPNVDGILWFLENIFPEIQRHLPETVFDVIGARPPAELIRKGQEMKGVNITGYVPNPIPYLQQAGVMVVPLRAGGGMRVKILNALSQALPIVSTTIGCEGIKVIHREHLMIADTPGEFVNAVLFLLENKEYAREMGIRGRKFVQENYDFRIANKPLDLIYGGIRDD